MTKVHLAANKGNNGTPVYARCAARSNGNGTVRRNTRDTYQNMSSLIVSFSEFKLVSEHDRCSHCIDMAYPVYARQMREKGSEAKSRADWLK